MGYSSPVAFETMGIWGGRRSSRASICFRGSLAGATIEVWKAWLTGSGRTSRPAARKIAAAFSTASEAPPTTAWAVLLTLATTTYPSTEASTCSISSRGAMTAIILPSSAMETLVISRPRAATASSASAKDRLPAATRAPYSPRLWPITKSGAMP